MRPNLQQCFKNNVRLYNETLQGVTVHSFSSSFPFIRMVGLVLNTVLLLKTTPGAAFLLWNRWITLEKVYSGTLTLPQVADLKVDQKSSVAYPQ